MTNWVNKISKIFGIEFISKNGVYSPSYREGAVKELQQETAKELKIKIKRQEKARQEVKDLFSKHQEPLLKLANNRFGRKFLEIETKDKIVKLIDNAFVVSKGNGLQATFRAYPVYAKRIGVALTQWDITKEFLTRNKEIYKGLDEYRGLLSYVGLTDSREFPTIMLASPETFYSGAGDGVVYTVANVNWATAHDAAVGDALLDEHTAPIIAASRKVASDSYYLYRGFLPFNTSALPDTVNISAATLTLTANAAAVGSSYNLSLVQTSQASTAGLELADYNNYTTTKGATDIARPTGAGNTTQFTLNVTGRGWISKTDWTKLGVFDSSDIANSDPGTNYYVGIRLSEYAGTASDPTLVVTYTAATSTTSTSTSSTSSSTSSSTTSETSSTSTSTSSSTSSSSTTTSTSSTTSSSSTSSTTTSTSTSSSTSSSSTSTSTTTQPPSIIKRRGWIVDEHPLYGEVKKDTLHGEVVDDKPQGGETGYVM